MSKFITYHVELYSAFVNAILEMYTYYVFLISGVALYNIYLYYVEQIEYIALKVRFEHK